MTTHDRQLQTDHVSVLIGEREADGTRTHLTPGEVCVACSDPDNGRWVPISFCTVRSRSKNAEES